MPNCKQCGNKFPNYIIIEGKQHNISKRTSCISCLPFGERNKKIQLIFKECICVKCGRSYQYHHTTSHTLTRCNSCMVNAQKDKRRIKSLEYLGGKCNICGYDKCNRALHFHHKDASIKLFGISGNHCLSWKRIILELDKCILLCSNCHIEVEEGITLLE